MDARCCLKTEELLLARYRQADRARFLALVLDPLVMAHVDGPGNKSTAITLFERILSEAPDQQRAWAIRLMGEGRHIGHAWISDSPDMPEIGFILASPYWGRGLATQAAEAVLEHGHGALALPRIAATVDVGHVPSRRVVEKIGMELERVVDDPDTPYAVYWSVRPRHA